MTSLINLNARDGGGSGMVLGLVGCLRLAAVLAFFAACLFLVLGAMVIVENGLVENGGD